MAYSEKQWLDAEGYFKAGLSLAQIQDKTGIARSTVSKMAKKQQWKQGANVEYIEAKEIIAVKKSTENQHLLNIADEVADDNIRRKNLIYGNAEKLARKLSMMTDQVDEPQDLKLLSEANDKLAITMKVADRHAPKGDVNVQTNLASTTVYTPEKREDN